ncbi:hypothetical protein SPAN111604_04185 [Sphingomonas antarctica]|uniref:nucleotidyltransferase family protein n=1 Tax=Sphingomonas antarctica TaxID=2040274 RepID=UPI0039E91120
MNLPDELWPLVWQRASGTPWPPLSDDEAKLFFVTANDHGLLPLLMVAGGLPDSLEAAKSRHRAWAAIYRKRHDLSRAALPRLAEIVGADAFTCYKGSDFQHRLYPDPALRPMSDLDVLVPRERFAELLDRLAAHGHDRKCGAHGAPFSPDHFEASIMFGEVHVELHQSFAQPVRNTIDYAGLMQRRETFVGDGLNLWRFSRADAILAQAFELAKDEFASKLIRHVDFHLLIEGHNDLLPLCVARAKQWQIQRALFGALELHRRLFPSVAGDAVVAAIDTLLTPRGRDRLRAHVLHGLDGHRNRAMQVQTKLNLIDSPWRRLALPVVAAWQEAKGRMYERRARRAGMVVPPRIRGASGG